MNVQFHLFISLPFYEYLSFICACKIEFNYVQTNSTKLKCLKFKFNSLLEILNFNLKIKNLQIIITTKKKKIK